jgi:hypothetical protein
MADGLANFGEPSYHGMNLSPSLTRRLTRHRFFLVGAIALTILLLATRAAVCWSNDRYVSPTNGVWLALATDLNAGVFYRPLHGPSGYGGTRYFPLFFVLYALLLKLGLPVLLSGYLLSAVGIVSLIAGTFYLLRKLGAEPWLAACSAGAVLAAGAVQLSLLSIHDDGIACALNIWGVAMSAHPKPSHSKILLAAVLFTLAWSTKVTTVFGFAAAFLWLIFAGLSRVAWELAAETACGCLLVAGAMVLGSHGRVVEIFKACASGGTTLTRTALGPFHMLSIAVRDDPGLLLFLFLALLVLPAKSLRSLPALLFVATAGVTAMIFGSPGASWNHLLDLQVAAVILFAAWLANEGTVLSKEVGPYSLMLATLLAAVPVVHMLAAEDRTLAAGRFEKVIAFIGDTHKPILAENPSLPVLAGQRPDVMDPFMLALLRERIPGFGEPLLEGLRNHAFCAVVLSMRDPRTDVGRTWYETNIFGRGFLPVLQENYRLASVIDGQYVYLPRNDTGRGTVQMSSTPLRKSSVRDPRPTLSGLSLAGRIWGINWAAEF